MGKLDGSCLCGGVTYACDADPVFVANCHCTDCQKQTGSAFSTVVGVPRSSLHVEGATLSSFTTVGTDTGQPAERQFCSGCGSPIATLSQAIPELALIKAGTLTDRSLVAPRAEVWCDSAQPWVATGEAGRVALGRGPSA
jgi:hypothetical protein